MKLIGDPPPETQTGEAGRAEWQHYLPPTLKRSLAVLRFELQRSRTPARTFTWLLLTLFPVTIMAIFRANGQELDERAWGIVLYLLVPQVTCVLGLLLWVCPLVHAELEGRTWLYLAVRPGAKLAVLLGKYVNGVAWTCSSGWLGLTVGMIIGQPEVASPWRLWLVLMGLVLAASLVYGAVFVAIGTVLPHRAIVLSVAYTLVFEVVMSNVPAVVNNLTAQHRLINLLWRGMDWSPPPETPFELTYSPQPAAMHLAALLATTTGCLLVAALVLRCREYVTHEQP